MLPSCRNSATRSSHTNNTSSSPIFSQKFLTSPVPDMSVSFLTNQMFETDRLKHTTEVSTPRDLPLNESEQIPKVGGYNESRSLDVTIERDDDIQQLFLDYPNKKHKSCNLSNQRKSTSPHRLSPDLSFNKSPRLSNTQLLSLNKYIPNPRFVDGDQSICDFNDDSEDSLDDLQEIKHELLFNELLNQQQPSVKEDLFHCIPNNNSNLSTNAQAMIEQGCAILFERLQLIQTHPVIHYSPLDDL
ncbi:hypothetical protein QTN25_001430 [Entamoeba marina]